jgi:chloride channel protein, CIC family
MPVDQPQLEAPNSSLVDTAPNDHGSLLALALLALIAGAAAGLVGAVFRLSIDEADRLRNGLIAWAHGEGVGGLILLVAACAGGAAAAAWLVRRWSPYASGSGIPLVEAVVHGDQPQAPFPLVPVKFIGGVLAIGSGLALGREGPSVQMGASIAHVLGRLFRRDWPDCRVLLAAGAGAGLATAFNAPIAGAVFVLEELVQRFEPRIAIAALGASATAIAVAHLLLPDAPDFNVGVLAYASTGAGPLYVLMGALAGLVAIAYNHALLGAIAAANRLSRFPVELRAGLIGAAIGVLGWLAPQLVGGGDTITQAALVGAGALSGVAFAFLIRFGLGAVSYAAGTPGGLFAPLLVLGAQIGLLFGSLSRLLFPTLRIQPEGFAVVGMAAFFTGVVRAPLTGIVLVTEMTANTTMLLPMLGACFAAMVIPTASRNPPIYESLRLGRAEETPPHGAGPPEACG